MNNELPASPDPRGENDVSLEEMESNYTYPPEYSGPKPIKEQITILAQILNLDPKDAREYVEHLPKLPEGAEGWFAIPSHKALEKLFPNITDDTERYCAGVRLVYGKIFDSRKAYSYRDGQIVPDRLRTTNRTTHALDIIAQNQPGDILVVPAQLGMRHRGRSVRRARECFLSNEFGLTALAVGSIILTHPNRLVRWEELDMDCAGDEFDDPDSGGDFFHAPLYITGGGEGGIMFGTRWYDRVYKRYGSASAFVL